MKVLNQIGLTESEIKVYFALLELESSTVGPLIEKAKVPDSKIYSILEKLKEKGLAGFVIKNNVKHFQASDPKNLAALLNEKEEEIAAERKELEEKIIPYIESRRKFTEEKQEATVYESYAGLKSAFNLILDNLTAGEEYCVFMLGESLKEKKVISFFQTYHKKRMEKGIRARLISNTEFKDLVLSTHHYKGMKIRFTRQKLPVGIFIFKNRVMTVLWGEKPTAFVITSKKNYDHYMGFFEGMWSSSSD
jgi:sugar-specific transcriptional regulator TrmB